MNPEIVRINEDTWRVEDQHVRFFILKGKEKTLLIDSGITTVDAKEIAEEKTGMPVDLINTHADPDHIAGNGSFERFYLHPAESVNLFHGQGKRASFVPVEDGDEIDIGGRILTVISIPGHTPGSIALLEKDRRILFSGDTVQNGRIFMFGPYREINAYRHSLLKLYKNIDLFDEIWPSHGTFPVEPGLIRKLYDESGRMMRHELKKEPIDVRGNAVFLYKTESAQFLWDE